MERYLELVEVFEDDVGDNELLGAVADLVEEELRAPGDRTAVERCLAFVEEAAGRGEREEVAYCFLDRLAPETMTAIRPLLGRRTKALLCDLDDGNL